MDSLPNPLWEVCFWTPGTCFRTHHPSTARLSPCGGGRHTIFIGPIFDQPKSDTYSAIHAGRGDCRLTRNRQVELMDDSSAAPRGAGLVLPKKLLHNHPLPVSLSHEGLNVLPGGYKVEADKCRVFVVVKSLDKHKGLARTEVRMR